MASFFSFQVLFSFSEIISCEILLIVWILINTQLLDGYARLSRKEGTGNRKQSNMADSTALFELESFAIKKVGTFDELAVDTD